MVGGIGIELWPPLLRYWIEASNLKDWAKSITIYFIYFFKREIIIY